MKLSLRLERASVSARGALISIRSLFLLFGGRVPSHSDISLLTEKRTENATCEPFTERFDNVLAGWAVTLTIGTKDEMTYC